MRALDTNIVVRFLVGDDEQQASKVRRLFSICEDMNECLFVSSTVLLETIWVLESAYECPRPAIIQAVNRLSNMTLLLFEDKVWLEDFLSVAQSSTFDLSDLLIAYKARGMDCECTLTFDKKASHFELFSLLE